jgi:TonB family protein
MAVSVLLHAAVLGGAVWLGAGTTEPVGRHDGVEPRAPLVAFLPTREVEVAAEPEPLVPELLPPVPEPEVAPADAWPDMDLVPELEPAEVPAVDAPDVDLAEALREAARRAAPSRPTRPPSEAVAPATVAPAPAASLPAAPLPAAPGRPLAARSKPTPTWPAGLAFDRQRHVGLLFYVRADGSVTDVRVESASGLALLDEHVRAFVARTWAFEPTAQPRWVRVGFRPGVSDLPR